MVKYVSVALGTRDELIAELAGQGAHRLGQGKHERAAATAHAIQQLTDGAAQVTLRHTTYVVCDGPEVTVRVSP